MYAVSGEGIISLSVMYAVKYYLFLPRPLLPRYQWSNFTWVAGYYIRMRGKANSRVPVLSLLIRDLVKGACVG